MFDLFLEVENFQHSRIFNQQEKKCHNFNSKLNSHSELFYIVQNSKLNNA